MLGTADPRTDIATTRDEHPRYHALNALAEAAEDQQTPLERGCARRGEMTHERFPEEQPR